VKGVLIKEFHSYWYCFV